MKERCRFCYKAKKAEFCKNIFNNKQINPSICKIVQMLTNLTIVENDPYTKLCCVDCFDVLILFYHFRESILQTNQLLINNKINKTNNNNLNVYNKWPGIVRENNGRFIRIDISLHQESNSTDEDRNTDKNNQDSNQYNVQSQKNSLCIESNNKEILSFLKEEFDIERTCVKIENDFVDEDRKIYAKNQDLNRYNEQSQKNCLWIESDNQDVFCVIKQEFDVEESRVKIERDSNDEEQMIDEHDYHLNIPADDDNNKTIRSDNKINNNDGFDRHCFYITEYGYNVEEFTSVIHADSNEDQKNQKENSYSNKSVEDNDNSDKVSDIAVVYVQDHNERQLESSLEFQKKVISSQHKNSKKKSKQLNECNICKEKFSKKSNLYLHLEKHSGENPHQCNICNEKFPRKGDLKRHLLTHIQCDICHKRFTVKGVLKRHLLIHTGEKPHQCNICCRKFSQKAHLKQHLLTHTGEKPHQCNICEKKFTFNGDLKKHLLTHTGEKPHQCNICEKKFTLKGQLKHHLLTHTGEKPHQCNICDRKFIRKDYLKHHLLTHTGEKPHQCNICDRKFIRKEHLRQHLLTHTAENFKPMTKV